MTDKFNWANELGLLQKGPLQNHEIDTALSSLRRDAYQTNLQTATPEQIGSLVTKGLRAKLKQADLPIEVELSYANDNRVTSPMEPKGTREFSIPPNSLKVPTPICIDDRTRFRVKAWLEGNLVRVQIRLNEDRPPAS
jgi:hypothetical protein